MDIQGVISIHHIRDDVGKNRRLKCRRLRRRTHEMDVIELL